MTRLEAVQEMLEAIGAPHASALASSGTWPSITYQETDAGDAERILDRESRKILSQGWFLNTLEQYRIYRPAYSVVVSGGAGAFNFAETVTGGTSGATGVYNYLDTVPVSDLMYLYVTSGTFQAAETLTGGTSGATRTAGAVTALTVVRKIAADPLWLSASANASEWKKLSMQYDSVLGTNFMVDMDPPSDANPTALTFDVDSLQVDAIKNLEFTTLPAQLAQWITSQACVAFQRYKKKGVEDDQMLLQRLMTARALWIMENTDNARTNVLTTAEAHAFKGGRRGVGYRHD